MHWRRRRQLPGQLHLLPDLLLALGRPQALLRVLQRKQGRYCAVLPTVRRFLPWGRLLQDLVRPQLLVDVFIDEILQFHKPSLRSEDGEWIGVHILRTMLHGNLRFQRLLRKNEYDLVQREHGMPKRCLHRWNVPAMHYQWELPQQSAHLLQWRMCRMHFGYPVLHFDGWAGMRYRGRKLRPVHILELYPVYWWHKCMRYERVHVRAMHDHELQRLHGDDAGL